MNQGATALYKNDGAYKRHESLQCVPGRKHEIRAIKEIISLTELCDREGRLLSYRIDDIRPYIKQRGFRKSDIK